MARGAATYKRVARDDHENDTVQEPSDITLLVDGNKAPDGKSGHSHWLLVVVLCTLISNICSIDRTAMSVAVLPMSQQYHWNDSVKGAVNGAFNIGYCFTNLFGGYLAACYGPKRTLAYGVVAWSAFTLFTPPAAATTVLWVLLVVRALMGLGEGVAFPCMQVLVKTWVPSDKRTRALGLVYSGHQVGSILSLLMSPGIIQHFGWPWVFYLFGSMGFGWLALWKPLVKGHPPIPPLAPAPAGALGSTAAPAPPGSPVSAAKAGVSGAAGGPGGASSHSPRSAAAAAVAAEAGGHGLIARGRESGSGSKPLQLRDLPWGRFVRAPTLWALLVAHAMFGVTYNMAMSWMPSYYNSAFGVNIKQSAFLTVVPFAVMAVNTNASGWIADALINRRLLSTTHTRKLLQLLGTGTPAACLWYLAAKGGSGSLTEALALLTTMAGGLGLQAGGFASTHQDISTRYAGVIFGITNAGSSLAGSVSVYLTGVVLDRTQNWSLVFQLVSVCNLFSLAVFLLCASSKPVFE